MIISLFVLIIFLFILYLIFHQIQNEGFNFVLLTKQSSQRKILLAESEIYNSHHKYHFIHIGKCGGTFLYRSLNFFKFNNDRTHINKPIFDKKKKYIIWIRNPINRFVSAFNYGKQVENFDINKIKKMEAYKIPLTIENSLSPHDVIKIYKNQMSSIREYKNLFQYFDTPNKLAESLSSDDIYTRYHAQQIMKTDKFDFTNSHISKGIGWYLDNGDFVEKYHDNIFFVGRKEKMKKDINKLAKLLGYKKLKKFNNQRVVTKSIKSTFLSPLAIKNIKDFYLNTDYRALDILREYKFINKKTLKEYQNYKPDI